MPKAKILQKGLLDTWGRKNRSIADKECEVCGKIFRPTNSCHRTCSRECGYAVRRPRPFNTGNGWINKSGYREIRVDGKIKREHRYIFEQYLKRNLNKNEDIHHINGIKTDNRIENLQLIEHGIHASISNNGKVYKRGYTMNLTQNERQRRSEFMKSVKLKQSLAKALNQ